MGLSALSIKNWFFLKPVMIGIIVLVLYGLSGLLSGSVYGFYHNPQETEISGLPDLSGRQSTPPPSDAYSVQVNNPKGDKTDSLHLKSVTPGLPAVDLNINISFNMLSETITIPEFSLDRQITANLKVKNIMDEYKALKRQNETLLKTLDVPYLRQSSPKANKPDSVQEHVRQTHQVKNEINSIMRFQEKPGETVKEFAYPSTAVGQAVSGSGKGNQGGGGDSIGASVKGYGASGSSAYYEKGYASGQDELPWVFRVAIQLIKFFADHKIELLLWSLLGMMIFTLGIVTLKR